LSPKDFSSFWNFVYEFKSIRTPSMRLTLSAVTSRKRPRFVDEALKEFTSRLAHYANVDQRQFSSEGALTKPLQPSGRPAKLILLDARGRTMSSEQLAT